MSNDRVKQFRLRQKELGRSKRELYFADDLIVAIQAYADSHCEGNFSLAVRQLINRGLLND